MAMLKNKLIKHWILKNKKKPRGVYSAWWNFSANFNIAEFKAKFPNYTFGLMMQYYDNVYWEPEDKLTIHLIYQHIKPTFKHIISKCCYHLLGPNVIKHITRTIKANLTNYDYVIRTDIKSYYASINLNILLSQLNKEFDDPILLKYFKQILFHTVYKDGNYIETKQGIAKSTGLSGFFAALYLKSLDQAMQDSNNEVLYIRYNDDIIIFTKTFNQYQRALKRLFKILKSLKLKIAKRKTKFGKISDFHFLGVEFMATRTANKPQKTQVIQGLHERTLQRACDKVCLDHNSVNPDASLRYLYRWAAWWHRTTNIPDQTILTVWCFFETASVEHAELIEPLQTQLLTMLYPDIMSEYV